MPRSYIYKIINLVNDRWYIGKHNGKDPNYMGVWYDKYSMTNEEK